jgi:hypothetical protein
VAGGLDRTRLARLLAMTSSIHDGEALTAVRMANRAIAAAGLTWEQVLGSRSGTAASTPDFRTPPSKRGTGTARYGRPAPKAQPKDTTRRTDADIDLMMSECAGRRHDVNTLMFLASLRDYWETHNYLTQDQYVALQRIYEPSNGGKGGFRW